MFSTVKRLGVQVALPRVSTSTGFKTPSTFTSNLKFSSAAFNKTQFRAPDSSKPRLVLAYSGGLDTSCQLNYLVDELGFEVAAYIADLGQSDLSSPEEVEKVKQKAKDSGAYAFFCEDLTSTFVNDYVYPLISASALYEGRYLLGTSIARPCIANRQIEICKSENAEFVSHGSTGKGNDQVRFELAYHCLNPSVKTITLWRDPDYCAKFQGRKDLQKYAVEKGIIKETTDDSKQFAYSEDENCMHISFESGELEDPNYPSNEFIQNQTDLVQYPGQVLQKTITALDKTPDISDVLKVDFVNGIPTKITDLRSGESKSDGAEIFQFANEIAAKHGVGGIDIVENRFVGMKSRGCYETPGATLLFDAHRDLEAITLDREVMRIRDSLSLKYAELVYNGYWFSPEMGFLKSVMKGSQKVVQGSATVELFKGNVRNVGRESDLSLYDEAMVSMDSHGEYDPSVATGFIKTLATRLITVRKRDSKAGREW